MNNIEIPSWQQQLRDCVTDPVELCHRLNLDAAFAKHLSAVCEQFPLRVPRSYIARMRSGDPQDPLLLQVLPQAREMQAVEGYSTDPLQERAVNPVPGLLHKYQGRVLLTLAASCAINCRYCFRRHFPYADNVTGPSGWQAMCHYIAQDSSIHEVILSGGEPLLVKDGLLAQLIEQLATIKHLQRLRIHTRLPVVIPARVNAEFIAALQSRLHTVIVLHINHPQALDAELAAACANLRENKITLLNQAVLLKGVNDSEAVQIALSERLFACGILPYYLHLLDSVAGSAHFHVDASTAQQIINNIKAKLPGYLVPKLAQEIPGALSKFTF